MPAYRLKAGDRAVIRRKVSAMHVSSSARDVLRPFLQHARKAFRAKITGAMVHLWKRRDVRRAVYREALRQHEKNRALFHKVATGQF